MTAHSKPKQKSSPPSPLFIQNLLREGKSFTELAQLYQLEVQVSPMYPDLKWFGMGDGDPRDPLVRQCRGLVLDAGNNWEVACRPLDHIFEWSAVGAPLLKWGAARPPRVMQKVDGWAVHLWCHKGVWVTSSPRNVDASEMVPRTGGLPIGSIFWKEFAGVQKLTLPPQAFKGCTFIFEVSGRHLSHVCNRRYRDSDATHLTLIAIRNNATGEEMDPAHFCGQGIRPYCEAFEDQAGYKSVKDVLDSVVMEDVTFDEGYVIIDSDWTRLAVTHPEYDTARRFRAQLNQDWLINNIRSRQPDTKLFNYAQDWVPLHLMLAKGYGDLVKRVSAAWMEHQAIQEDVAFMTATNHLPFRDVLIKRRFQEISSLVEGLKEVPAAELVTWFEVPALHEAAA